MNYCQGNVVNTEYEIDMHSSGTAICIVCDINADDKILMHAIFAINMKNTMLVIMHDTYFTIKARLNHIHKNGILKEEWRLSS